MKRFRLTLTVFALLSLCLLVSAKDAAEWGGAIKAFKKAKKAVGTAAKKTVSFVKTTAKKTTNAVKDKVITRPTFYGECERKKKSLFGTCGKDTECVPKESGCKGACACDKTGVNECKCRGLFGNGLRKKAIHLFFEKDTDLEVGKALGAFVAGITNGKNDIAKQFDNEQCRDEFKSLKEDIQLDMKAMNLKFRKALNLAEDRKSEETAFLKSFEGKALIELQERYKRLVQKILNVLQKGLFVASKCGVEEKYIKLLGVTSAALMIKESYLAGKHSDEATKGDITKTTRNILEYLPVAAKELPEELSKEAYFKVLGNVVRHIVAGKRDAAVNSETLFRKFGFPEEPRNSLVKDVEMLLSSEGSLVTFESNQDMFKVKKKTYKSIGFKLHAEILVVEGERKLKKGAKAVAKNIEENLDKGARKLKKTAKAVGKWIDDKIEDLGKWFKDKLGKKSKFQPGTPEHPFKNRISKPWGDIKCVDPECAPDNGAEAKESKVSVQANEVPYTRSKSSYSGLFLETSSSPITGDCDNLTPEKVFHGIDTSCKSSYDISVDQTPNLLTCLLFVAGGEEVVFTRGEDYLKLYPAGDTVKYELKCEGGRRRLLQLGGKGGSS